MAWAGYVERMEHMRINWKFSFGPKTQVGRQLRRLRLKRGHKFKIVFYDWGCESVDWIEVAQDGAQGRTLYTR
jgi:hypothetical protein